MNCRPGFPILAAGILLATTALGVPPQLYCNREVYPPPGLTWSHDASLTQVTAVFPHPLLPGRVVLVTRMGLSLSDDAGLTWKALPEASVDKVGLVQKVAFHPTQLDTFYLAGPSGIWVTSDAGASFRQIGTKAGGMAADTAQDILVYPADPFHHTLLAVHGSEAEGVSRSRDGGRTWDVLNPGYFFNRVLAPERRSKELYLVGATKADPDTQNLYVCNTPGELAIEVMHDVSVTDMAFSLNRAESLYVATSDSGLYRVDNTEFTPASKLLGSKDDNWASVATTWGPDADVLSLCLYNPSHLGLVFSTDDLSTTRRDSGLPTGTFVKEGAAVRPNANGTIFYAAINEGLIIGRPDERVPAVNIAPASFEPVKDARQTLDALNAALGDFLRPGNSIAKAARDLCQRFGDLDAPYRRNQMTITARLPVKPAPPVSVTADLSRLGGSEATPLYDDGRHEDGAAGDGVYGYSFFYAPMSYHDPEGDWRPSWPGRVAIGVTASYADGSRQGAVGIAGIYPEVQKLILSGYYQNWLRFTTTGDLKAEPIPNPVALHKRPTSAMRVRPGHGPWSVLLETAPWNGGDITGYQSLSFGIRLEAGAAPKELYVQLRDEPDLTEATTTDRVEVIHDGLPGGVITSDYQTVVVPFSKLLGKQTSQFQTSKLSRIIISGDGGEPASLVIDWPCYLAPDEEANPATKAPSK